MDTDGHVSSNVTFLTEGVSFTVGFLAVSIGEGAISRSTIAGFVSNFVISDNSIFAGITILAESGTGAFLTFGVTFLTSDLVGGINELIEATGTDTLAVN